MSRPLITSVHNPRVKEAARLRDRRQREKQHRLIIDGGRETQRALEAGIELTEVFICEGYCYEGKHAPLVAELAHRKIPLLSCTPEVFAKLAFGDRNDGLVAVASTPHTHITSLTMPEQALVAVLVGLEKPGNLGAVLRSADAAGVNAVIVADGRTDLYNPNAIRASLGTIFTVPVCSTTSAAAMAWLREHGFHMFAARVDAEMLYTDADLTHRASIILGSEAEGLPDIWRADDVQAIRLPMNGAADSLNVSATAAVLFYESVRQRAQAR